MRIVITTASRCPQGILWAPHFRADGSCRCETRPDEEALKQELRRIEREARAAARQARTLLAELGER